MLAELSPMLQEVNIFSTFVRLLLATVFGGIVGLERGSKRRAAGFRTYMLVCVGAALVMITNQYISTKFGSDPARMGAQVINGIGFLGAGTIIVTRHNQVIGLTTAAGLWASACIGLAIGIGFYAGALMATFFLLLIITTLHRVDRRVVNKSQNIELYVELIEGARLSELIQYARLHEIHVRQVEFARPKYHEEQQIAVLLSLHLPERRIHHEVVAQFSQEQFVSFVEEI